VNDAERQILIEQVNAAKQSALDLARRLGKDHPPAGSAAQSYIEAIAARCDAARGLLKAQDWE
jgi:hypothetical protein